MPIYAYKCASCGHAQDVLQKLSDAPLTVCPACGQSTFSKQVTAAGFQLKGSGWYVTDFRDKPAPAKGDGKATESGKSGDAAAAPDSAKDAAKDGGKAVPAPAPSSAPAATAGSSPSPAPAAKPQPSS